MPAFTERFDFAVDGVDCQFQIVQLTGREGISELFHFDLTMTTSNAELDFDSVVGADATLTVSGSESHNREIRGIVSRFEQGEQGERIVAYRATMVPKAWRLEHCSNCRIFQAKTVQEIVTQLLDDAGLEEDTDYRFAFTDEYDPREYCVQYRETDWSFICRLLEEEGFGYFFEYSDDGKGLVFFDSDSVYQPLLGGGTMPFLPDTGALMGEERVISFQVAQQIRPGGVRLRAHNFEQPDMSLEVNVAAERDATLELYDYPGNYTEEDAGTTQAQRRLESVQTFAMTGDGESWAHRLTPGFLMSLQGHPRDSFNRDYLITSVEHFGFEPNVDASDEDNSAEELPRYSNRFQCIPAEVPYRPQALTPRPTIGGAQTAVVVGSSGNDIETDQYGRIKVQFHWDRLGESDENSSCWLRVAQPIAGTGWGTWTVPRVGQEVVVAFLEGDPDRPLVTGTVYHAVNATPYTLPDDKTISTIKSQTYQGEGFNELRFQDLADSEEIYLHAQKDLTIKVLNDRSTTIDHDDVETVTNDQTSTVTGNQTLSVEKDRERTVTGKETVTVEGERSVSIGADDTYRVGGNLAVAVSGNQSREVTGNDTESTDGDVSTTVGGSHELSITGDTTVTAAANSTENVELEKTIEAGTKIVLVCGSGTVTLDSDGNITVEGSSLTLKSSGATQVDAASVDVTASGSVTVSGASVGIN